ncbi:MAG: hypothetical protein RSA27_05925, partial [Oscillospiraceae bacterium]
MLTSMSVFTVSAAGETTFTIQSYPSGWDNSVKIQDTIAGAVFTAKPIYSAGTKATQYRYQWKVQAGDIYRNIPWECGVKNWDETAVHIVSTAEKLSETIGVEITPLDQNGKPTGLAVFENYVGNVMAIKTNKTNYAGDFGVTEEAWGQHQQTPAQYKFKVKGNNTEFILLDCSAYDGAYYVMMEEGVEKRAFGATNKLEPTVETSVSYWLNNDFLNGATLPQKIKDNLSVNREWRVEGRATWPGIWDAYTINASVNMLSLTEFLKYKGQFGLKLNSYTDGVDNEAWWLSTSSGENRALSSMQYGWWHDGKPSSGSYGVTGAIGDRPIDGRTDDDSTLIQWVRPTFYLNH